MPDPGENPIFLPGTNQIISDIVFSYFQNPAVGQGVTFVSDGDPNFQQWVDSALQLPFHVLPESGNLDDVTPLLGPTPGLMIQVQSDAVIPEPSTLLLVASGLVGIAAARRQRS
ncbi:MAG TPA: PEP-CTERM sorting domain-containing protein [Myxococcota bacterium]|nr:PEP-CTERM sorting domain-containing protein [Myxococcota bacterium]